MTARRVALAALAISAALATPAGAAEPIACVVIAGEFRCVYPLVFQGSIPSCKVSVGYCEPGAGCKVNVGYCASGGNCLVNVGLCDEHDTLPVGV